MSGFQKSKDVSWTKMEGLTVILDTRESRKFHEFDEVATFLWDALDRAKNSAELVKVLMDDYDVDSDQAGLDVAKFLEDLKRKKLLL